MKAKKVTKIIEKFLDKIPKLSPQFRIQAAKIKTDKILSLAKKEVAKREFLEKRKV